MSVYTQQDVLYQIQISDVNKPFSFLYRFSKNIQTLNFMKSRPVGGGGRNVPCGQTDVTKLTVAIRNFANAPKNPRSAYRLYLRVFYASQYEQQLFPSTRLSFVTETVFTARSEPNLYIKFKFVLVFQGLK